MFDERFGDRAQFFSPPAANRDFPHGAEMGLLLLLCDSTSVCNVNQLPEVLGPPLLKQQFMNLSLLLSCDLGFVCDLGRNRGRKPGLPARSRPHE